MLRKTTLFTLVFGLFVFGAPVQASTTGDVALPANGLGRAQRCADTTAGSQGLVGRTIDVTSGQAFELKATGPTAPAQDFDIDFYVALTPCQDNAIAPALTHENVDGDEAGIVPPGATKAVVRLHRGAAGQFEYTEEQLVDIAPKGRGSTVTAVIDTGLRATHQEFDYCDCGDTTTGLDPDPSDQIVAWWDFSRENPDGPRLPAAHLPAPGQVWDTRVADPYDNHGHGTATASLAVGANKNLDKDIAFAPGMKLAVAKVGEGDGTISGSVVSALRWAVDDVGADVVTMSIGAVVPLPPALAAKFHTEAARAREKGVLVVVSNGNGFANTSLIPGEPGWATPYGYSTNVLSVGAGGHLPFSGLQTGYQATSDGEVTAKYTAVGVADNACDDCYTAFPGTSFSAPLVAGMAARIHRSINPSKNATPDYVETLLKYSARDTQTPPNYEGYGRLDYHQFFGVALPHAESLALPARPSPDINALYVEQVGGTLRDTWTNKLDVVHLPESIALRYLTPTGLPSLSGAGAVGASSPTGAGDAEIYTLDAQAGETVTVSAEYGAVPQWDGLHDFDIYVFSGLDPSVPVPSYSAVTEVARGTNGAGVPEKVTFTAPQTGTYHVVVLGWTIVQDQPFTLTSPSPLTFVSEGAVVHDYGF